MVLVSATRSVILSLCALGMIAVPRGMAGETGKIAGTVRLAPNGAPAVYANVFIPSTRQATRTDTTGRFVIPGVHPGTVGVATLALGFPTRRDTVAVFSGQVTRLDVVLENRHTRLQDSLQRIGRWPPQFDSTLAAGIRSCRRIRLYRSLSEFPPKEPGGTRFAGVGRQRELTWRDSLLSALRVADYASRSTGCACWPDMALLLSGDGPDIVITICYECGYVQIKRAGFSQGGYFGAGRDRFLRLQAMWADSERPRRRK